MELYSGCALCYIVVTELSQSIVMSGHRILFCKFGSMEL